MLYCLYKWIRFFYYRYVWKKPTIEGMSKEVAKYKHCVQNYTSCAKWFISEKEFQDCIHHSKYKNEILSAANDILSNKMPILSSHKYDLGHNIKWNYDYEVGQGFISLKEAKEKGCDIKKAWELSRMHQLLPLIKAFYLTNDDSYIKKVYQLTDDWNINNPVFQGVNWSNPMETAIRCANLINVIQLCPLLKENRAWMDRINDNLLCSAIYIWNNLENKTLVNNNHYLSDLVGLIFIAIYFKGVSESKVKRLSAKWLKFALQELKKELKYQILPDGGIYELSTSYHVYDMELILYTQQLLQANDLRQGIFLNDIIEKMYTFLENVSVDGKISFIGDNDSSHLFRQSDLYPFEPYNDNVHLLNLCREKLLINYRKINVFPHSGIYRLESDKLTIFVKCCRFTKATGHSHNDQLSYVLWYNGMQIVADPGTYCYTSDLAMRNIFRGTSYHNVVQIGNEEQNSFKSCFAIEDKCKSVCVNFSLDKFEGEHYGYYSSHTIKVRRSIWIERKQVCITDCVGSANAITRITLSPDVKILNNNRFQMKNCFFRIECNAPYNIRNIKYSPNYGMLMDSNQIEFAFQGTITYKIIFE